MRTGDATLNEMSPPEGTMGRRASVEFYEVGADFRAWAPPAPAQRDRQGRRRAGLPRLP